VFDLLHLDGGDTRPLPLTRRKELLAKVIRNLPLVRLSEHVADEGKAFFKAAAARGLEGIMAKNGDSRYREGTRSLDWLKIKTHRRQEAVIGGFTEPRGSRRYLGSLLLGVFEGNDLVYIGHTGGGFDSAGLKEMYSRLKPLERKQCPFVKPPKPNAPVHWVEPKLVCEVKFQEWTADGRMRQPIFIALRDDKPARSVRREVAHPVKEAVHARRKKTAARS
jgi:bifunctional non-homologous end joining protein LigD